MWRNRITFGTSYVPTMHVYWLNEYNIILFLSFVCPLNNFQLKFWSDTFPDTNIFIVHSRDFSTSTRMTQASIIRSSTRVVDRINPRSRRDSEGIPEASSLVALDRERICRSNSNSNGNGNSNLLQPYRTNGVISSQHDHTLLSVTNGSAITRVWVLDGSVYLSYYQNDYYLSTRIEIWILIIDSLLTTI